MQNYGQLPKLPVPPSAPQTLYAHVHAGDRVGGASFGDTITQMLGKANNIMAQPENLSIEAVKTGKVDIHEVMIALGKSEVAFKLITAMTQKVVGAFDKLTSMQV